MRTRPINARGTVILQAPAEPLLFGEDADSDDKAPAQPGTAGVMLPSEAEERVMDLEAEVEELQDLVCGRTGQAL